MKDIFDRLSASCSKAATKAYSTSFSLGILFLGKRMREPIYNIYGFVRFADEIADSFHAYDRQYLMAKFRHDTVEALKYRISLNPILNSFQQVVYQYNIDWPLIDTFLKSMEMDLQQKDHNSETYQTYILGSAEVVGLMCLKVFAEGDVHIYKQLKPYAMRLGAAFQKVNFLRDLKADYEELGRNYFPGVNFSSFTAYDKERIQQEIEDDFSYALQGIRQLPVSSRRGVYLAYYYYSDLFKRIKRMPAEKVISSRIRIPDVEKFGLMFQSFVRHQLNLL